MNNADAKLREVYDNQIDAAMQRFAAYKDEMRKIVQERRGRVRILIQVCTNRGGQDTTYAFDFYRSWPFFAFEVLKDEE